jgi:hypothetical protein
LDAILLDVMPREWVSPAPCISRETPTHKRSVATTPNVFSALKTSPMR